MEYGEPIQPEEYAGWDDDRLVEEVRRRMHDCLVKAQRARALRSKPKPESGGNGAADITGHSAKSPPLDS